MIAQANAIKIFNINIDRTNMLIGAVDKIKAYNRRYQESVAKTDAHLLPDVEQCQNRELEAIERSCAEHAIISLATVFETYCRELLQELLATKPDYFTNKHTKYTNKINDLFSKKEPQTCELIENELNIQGRKNYAEFFQSYNIPFINDTELELVEYIYALRNHFVHNASRPDQQRDQKLKKINHPVQETNLVTRVKKLRTKVERMIIRIDAQIKETVALN